MDENKNKLIKICYNAYGRDKLDRVVNFDSLRYQNFKEIYERLVTKNPLNKEEK